MPGQIYPQPNESEIITHLDILFPNFENLKDSRPDEAVQILYSFEGSQFVLQRYNYKDFSVRGLYAKGLRPQDYETFAYSETSDDLKKKVERAIYDTIATCSGIQFALQEHVEALEERFDRE